jgi:hypothetical protein
VSVPQLPPCRSLFEKYALTKSLNYCDHTPVCQGADRPSRPSLPCLEGNASKLQHISTAPCHFLFAHGTSVLIRHCMCVIALSIVTFSYYGIYLPWTQPKNKVQIESKKRLKEKPKRRGGGVEGLVLGLLSGRSPVISGPRPGRESCWDLRGHSKVGWGRAAAESPARTRDLHSSSSQGKGHQIVVASTCGLPTLVWTAMSSNTKSMQSHYCASERTPSKCLKMLVPLSKVTAKGNTLQNPQIFLSL